MRRTLKFIIASAATVAILAIFYFFFPHIWGEWLYPLDYKDSIKKYSTERNLNPNFVCGIIYTESRFNAGSTSGVGARGLMQIMPGTAASISQEMGENSVGDLYDPDVSIRYGTWYIKGLVDKYGGDKDLALAAYNAGSGRADQYRESGAALPYETVMFVQKVKGAEEMYNKVYDSWYAQSISEKKNPVSIGFTNISDYVKKLILGNK